MHQRAAPALSPVGWETIYWTNMGLQDKTLIVRWETSQLYFSSLIAQTINEAVTSHRNSVTIFNYILYQRKQIQTFNSTPEQLELFLLLSLGLKLVIL